MTYSEDTELIRGKIKASTQVSLTPGPDLLKHGGLKTRARETNEKANYPKFIYRPIAADAGVRATSSSEEKKVEFLGYHKI